MDRIGDLLESGELKDIIAVPTSERTYEQAKGAHSPQLATTATLSYYCSSCHYASTQALVPWTLTRHRLVLALPMSRGACAVKSSC